MIDGQRTTAAVRQLGRGGERPDGPGRADRRRPGLGHLPQRSAGCPLGHHDAAGTAAHHIQYAGQARRVDPAQPQRARQDALRAVLAGVVGGLLIGVDEGQGDLAIELHVQGLPEAQATGAAVIGQQPVAATGHRGARDQLRPAL